MRSIRYFTLACLLGGCGDGGAAEGFFESDEPSGGGAPSDAEPPGAVPQSGPEQQLVSGQPALVGVTRDGWAVYRDESGLRAVTLSAEPEARGISDTPGSVLIRDSVVFNWANMDWTMNVGDLSVWTAEAGAQSIGATPYAEGLVATSAGSTIAYTSNHQAETADLMVASADMASPAVLIESMGLGSESTCGARIGFVGESLFVGWCEAGSRAARIERYDRSGETWEATLIADDALPAWSAAESGKRVFFQSSQYAAYFSEGGQSTLIDASVAQGQIVPDGSAAFYTVGDQLRRSELPEVEPVPIVTTGYRQPVGFSPRFDMALYSTTVTYESGTQRDLLMVSTEGFNPEPIVLVEDPVAMLARSTMTSDGRFVLYLTDVTPRGGTLHVADRDGSEPLRFENVLEVVALEGSTVLLTDNASDPEQYPFVADLKLMDLAVEKEPRLVEEKVLEPRTFQVSAEKTDVIYVRSGIDRDPADADSSGLFWRSIE
ncbi:MAG TPA: hypothetical protein VJN18_05600 [Polyangiaceae bacterium]|nr:hypothetical protein [Polyangiaceae bacterium]